MKIWWRKDLMDAYEVVKFYVRWNNDGFDVADQYHDLIDPVFEQLWAMGQGLA